MDNSDIKCGLHGRFIKTWVNCPGIRWFQLGGNHHTVLKIQVRLIQHATADQNQYIVHKNTKSEKARSESHRYADWEKVCLLFKAMIKSPCPTVSLDASREKSVFFN